MANLHSGRFHDIKIFIDHLKTIIAPKAMVNLDLAKTTSAILKVHNILMNEPAFRWPHWARIRTDEPLELSKRLWRRQELNSKNEMVQILFFSDYLASIVSHLAMSGKRSGGPLV